MCLQRWQSAALVPGGPPSSGTRHLALGGALLAAHGSYLAAKRRLAPLGPAAQCASGSRRCDWPAEWRAARPAVCAALCGRGKFFSAGRAGATQHAAMGCARRGQR
ncbi:hypothetical protein GQ54DRAFT_114619 [Martensiomyces pterosporus]|nr:hypothetical protein GQ54DRAFT_114619 [Martensiomyces pterosporus]